MNLYYHYKVGLNMRYFWSEIFKFIPAFVAPTIVGILIVSFVDLYYPILFLIFGVVYVIVFMVSMWFLGMNQFEKELVTKPIRKFFNR